MLRSRARRALLLSFVLLILAPLMLSAETLDEARRAQLEAELAQIERDIAEKRGVLTEKQKERTSLEREISILDTRISKAKLEIKQSDLNLRKLKGEITTKEAAIREVDAKVVQGQESLAQLIRKTREIDDISLAELALSGSLSQFFEEIDNFDSLQESLDTSFEEMATLREELSGRKRSLEEKEDEAQKVREVQVLAKKAIEEDEKEKQQLLTVTKGQERAYQQLIADREKQAAQIRAKLFDLRDSGAIPFGTAYQYAKDASAQTGVRPAVILAILREETNLGANIGSCTYHSAMHPTRDQPIFKQLMQEIGRDPETAKVSCKPSYGWGGAMGPAQFIPSTWVLYKERIGKIVGTNPPDPYNPRTAVFATALLMADNGADKGTREAERLAALRYFAGWANANKRAYAFYGDDVMTFADSYQRDINILEGR